MAMNRQSRAPRLRGAVRAVAGGVGFAAAAYATYAALAWLRYGHVTDVDADAIDPLLDRFMPHYDVVERHNVRVAAPAPIALAAAREQNLMEIPVVRAIF